MLSAPLTAVLMLRQLHVPTWQYGPVLGLPCLGGVLGAAMTGWITRRCGQGRVLLTFGVLWAPWLLFLPLAGPGPSGLAVLLLAETGLLVAAGVFNPTFVTYRMEAVIDGYVARVGTAWSISSKVAQPAFIAVGGVLATLTDVRTALACAGVCCAASAALMPWKEPVHSGRADTDRLVHSEL
jgi:MFS family permease